MTSLMRATPQQRQIFELRFLCGFTIEETSAMMDVPQAGIKRQWASALATLLVALKESLDTDFGSNVEISELEIMRMAKLSPNSLHKVAAILGLSRSTVRDRVMKRSRQRSKSEPLVDPSAQRS